MDAARIDGCSEFRILTDIVLPLTKSSGGALGIFRFYPGLDGFHVAAFNGQYQGFIQSGAWFNHVSVQI